MHVSIICRYGRPGLLHKCVKELSPQMCAALLKMQTRATTSSARSKHWFQLHTLVHALILCICGCNRPLHVFAKLRRPWTCAALSGMQRRATMSSTRSKHWCQSHTLLTVLHMPAVFATQQKHVMAYCGHICRVLEHAQVCVIGTSALTWQSLLWLSFAFLTMLHTSADLIFLHTYAVAQGDRIYRLLERA